MRKALLIPVSLLFLGSVFFYLKAAGLNESKIAIPPTAISEIPSGAYPAISQLANRHPYPAGIVTPIPLQDCTFSIGDYSFGAMDCATDYDGEYVTARYTILAFGPWAMLTEFRFETIVLAATATLLILGAFVWFWPRRAKDR